MSTIDTGCCWEACILLLSRALMLVPGHLWKSWESESLLLSKVPEACMAYWSLSLACVTEKKKSHIFLLLKGTPPSQLRTELHTVPSLNLEGEYIIHLIFSILQISPRKMNSEDQLPRWNEGIRNFIRSKRLFNKETKYYYKNEEEIMKSLIENFKYPYSLRQNVQNILSCLFSATHY